MFTKVQSSNHHLERKVGYVIFSAPSCDESSTTALGGGGGRANTHSKITANEKVLFVKQVLLIFSCLSFAGGGGGEQILTVK
jgi:hypothetical protein